MRRQSTDINVTITLEWEEGKEDDFTVGHVSLHYGLTTSVRPEHDGGIDRVWPLLEADTPGHSYLMLKWRPPLLDDTDDATDPAECTINCPGCQFCQSSHWQQVDAKTLHLGEHVRDTSPGAGYEGTVFSINHHNGSFTHATIHWNKWQGEPPLVDNKYPGQMVEVYR